jgi:di/tricarboxylate transporter
MSKVILPMAIGIGAGSFMTLAGSGMTVFTSNFLIDAGLDGLAYFESTKIALPSLIIQVLAFILIGYKVLPNTHVKPDAAVALKADSLPSSFNGKMGISAAILIFTITGMVINSPKLPMQVCAAIGAMASVFTGCLTEKDMYKSINWGTVAIIGGMSIVGKGVQASGLGDFIANGTINALGNNPSPFSIVAVMLLSTGLITQFMSNNAACALMAPIALSLSNTLGYDPRAFLIAVMFGSGIGTLTVMATPVMAFMMDIGHYTPKDFFKWGAVLLIPNSIIIMILVSVFYL